MNIKQARKNVIEQQIRPWGGLNLEVVAQVLGITESSGTCTMRFIGSDIEKTVKVSAQSASDYTQCFPIEFPLSELPSGSGIVTVKYESEFHLGTSAANSVVIP